MIVKIQFVKTENPMVLIKITITFLNVYQPVNDLHVQVKTEKNDGLKSYCKKKLNTE